MKYIFIYFLILISITTNAQLLKGTVRDVKGNPIEYCTLKFKDSKNGTVSDVNGNFSIRILNNNKILQVSKVGYNTLERKINEKDTLITVTLEESSKVLYEIVTVSAYSTSGKRIKGSPSVKNHANNSKITDENNFIKTACENLSTFSIDDDKASYSYVRRQIIENKKVPNEIVKLEEMINYFDYDYEAIKNKNPYNFYTELTTCPWNKEHQLMKIALKSSSQNTTNDLPSNYVFLIDVSGSMRGEDRLPLVKKSLLLLLDSLQQNDLVSIVTYAGKSGVVLEPIEVSNKKVITEALNNLNAGGRTAGSSGIELAYEIAETSFIEGANNRVILATDGDFNLGLTSYNDLEKLITKNKQTGIFLTCLGYGTGNYKDKTMELLADKGNGNYYYISDTIEAIRVLQKDFKGTINTVAKDVKIQVEFNADLVKEYRLIGYENRMLNKEDFANDAKDAGELGEGHAVTALYELILTDINNNEEKDSLLCKTKNNTVQKSDMAIIRSRYKNLNSNKSKKLDFIVSNLVTDFGKATKNTKWASCVAMFGMMLQDSKYKGSSTKENILSIAKESLNINCKEEVEFVTLLEKYFNTL